MSILNKRLIDKDDLLELREVIKDQEIEIQKLRLQLDEAKRGRTTGIACVEAVMNRGIEWVNVEKMDYQAHVDYFNNAQELLRDTTLINECNKLRADWARFAISEAPDFGAVRDMRMCVNALELLFERLASIPDPHRDESVEEPHAAI